MTLYCHISGIYRTPVTLDRTPVSQDGGCRSAMSTTGQQIPYILKHRILFLKVTVSSAACQICWPVCYSSTGYNSWKWLWVPWPVTFAGQSAIAAQDIIPESDCEFCSLSHLLASLLDPSLSQGQVEASGSQHLCVENQNPSIAWSSWKNRLHNTFVLYLFQLGMSLF